MYDIPMLQAQQSINFAFSTISSMHAILATLNCCFRHAFHIPTPLVIFQRWKRKRHRKLPTHTRMVTFLKLIRQCLCATTKRGLSRQLFSAGNVLHKYLPSALMCMRILAITTGHQTKLLNPRTSRIALLYSSSSLFSVFPLPRLPPI